MNAPNDLRDTFFLECEDLLEAMGEGLRDIDIDDNNTDVVNLVFRSVHSIKGGAGAFKLTELVEFAHCFETLLDELRAENLVATADLLTLMHQAGDHLSDMVINERDELDQDSDKTGLIKAEIEKILPESADEDPSEAVAAFVPMALSLDPIIIDDQPNGARYIVSFTPHDELYANGNEPALLARELDQLGEVTVKLHIGDLPDLSDLNISKNYFSWEFSVETDQGLSAVRQTFEFVEATSDLNIAEATDA